MDEGTLGRPNPKFVLFIVSKPRLLINNIELRSHIPSTRCMSYPWKFIETLAESGLRMDQVHQAFHRHARRIAELSQPLVTAQFS